MEKRWKRAFFVLLTICTMLFLTLVVLYVSLISSTSTKPVPDVAPVIPKSTPIFTITANKTELTQLINQKLIKNKEGNINYSVSLQDDIQLKGTIKVFSDNIPFIMLFSPSVTKDGQVTLKEKSFRLGKLYLPSDQVLKFIRMGTTLPNWIVIDPAKKQIDVNLSKAPINGQLYLRADRIDLKHDVLQFSIYQK